MAMIGIWAGAFVHVILAAAGLSVILVTSTTAFTVVKWVGAAYLVWLGWQALRAKSAAFDIDQPAKQQGSRSIFLQGMLIDILNPKVAIFFLAFLPQFVVEGAGPVSAQLFLHGSLIIVVAMLIEPLFVIAASRIAGYFKGNQRIGVWLDRCLGAFFIALGVRLALSEK